MADELYMFGTGTRSRTQACGFGDHRATVTLYRYIMAESVRFELTEPIRVRTFSKRVP